MGRQYGDRVLIVDAGGGTIDISSYTVTDRAPLQAEELFQPECELTRSRSTVSPVIEISLQGLLQGGEFVTVRARDMVSGEIKDHPSAAPSTQPPPEKLKSSEFNTPGDLANFSRKFDDGLKRVFSNENGIQFVKFGSLRDNDPEHGIKAGKLSLKGYPLFTLPTHPHSHRHLPTGKKSRDFLNLRFSSRWTLSGKILRKYFP